MATGGALDERAVRALERIATANEDLIKLATEEKAERELPVEAPLPGLPICPHCHTANPDIRNEGGTGPFAEFILVAACGNCQNTFLATAEGWTTFKTKDEFERRENGNIGT